MIDANLLTLAYRPRRPQAASDSNAATRQQTQKDNIASSDPQLVKKIVVRGSWLVARKSLPLYSDGLWSNLSGGLPTGSPYNTATQAVFFANCDRPPANCVHFMNLSRQNAASESERKAVVRGSWLVKACHHTRIGCAQISQRAAQGSLYRAMSVS